METLTWFEIELDDAGHSKVERDGHMRVTAEDGRVFFVQSGGKQIGAIWRHRLTPFESDGRV